jgi:hypothetical protein
MPLAAFATPMDLSTAEAARAIAENLDTGDFVTYNVAATNGLISDAQGLQGAHVATVLVRTGD